MPPFTLFFTKRNDWVTESIISSKISTNIRELILAVRRADNRSSSWKSVAQRLVLICLSSQFLPMLMEFNPFIFWWGKSERIKGQRENGKIFAEICFYFNSFPFEKVQLPPGNVDSCFRIPLWVFFCNLFFFSYRIQFFISKRELFFLSFNQPLSVLISTEEDSFL